MTHMREMSVSEGDFAQWERAGRECRNRHCSEAEVWVRCWESSDGGYEDYEYECRHCDRGWWIDGIDS